jgi:hypothetical protein
LTTLEKIPGAWQDWDKDLHHPFAQPKTEKAAEQISPKMALRVLCRIFKKFRKAKFAAT